jgi:maleylacetoacetate isomerase
MNRLPLHPPWAERRRMANMINLHSFFNSSTSFRVRIALALKSVPFECIPVDLRANGQRDPAYLEINPSAGVPVLADGDFMLTQSLAIADYLDGRFPLPRLLPQELRARARVLELSQAVACDIHPVNNMRVQRYLKQVLGATEDQAAAWYRHWVAEGLGAVERLLQRHGGGEYCFADQPTLADCCLVPQVFNSLRMGCALDGFPRVMAVYGHCMAQPAFLAAAPSNQVDYADGPRAAQPQGGPLQPAANP